MARKKSTSKKQTRSARTVSTQPAPARRVAGMMKVFQFAGLRQFFAVRQNVIKVLVVVVILGLAYLFKDVFIVAVVNGQPVYRWTLIKRLEQQGGSAVVNSLITETLVRQAIRTAGVTISQEEIDLQIKQIEDRLAAQGTTLDEALAQQGLTRAQLTDDIRLQKSAEQIVAGKITVSEEEVDAYLTENAAYFPETLTGDALRQTAREEVYGQKLTAEIQAWVQGLHDEAEILYLKKYAEPTL